MQGAGAVGRLVGFYLARAGHPVTLGFRRRPDAWPHRDGSPVLSLLSRSPDAEGTVPVRLAWPGEKIPAVDLLLLATKAQDAGGAAEQAKDALAPGGAAVLLSNGLGLEPSVSALFRPERLFRGIVYFGALAPSPGAVRRTGEGKIVLGPWASRPGTGDNDRLPSIANVFREAGIPAEIAGDIRRALWEKAMANLAINPLGALARARNGVVGTDPLLAEVARRVLREARSVAAAEGVTIETGEAERIFRTTAAATAENENSMLRDILAGRPTEIDFLNGYVARQGKEGGIPVPCNSALAALVKVSHPSREA